MRGVLIIRIAVSNIWGSVCASTGADGRERKITDDIAFVWSDSQAGDFQLSSHRAPAIGVFPNGVRLIITIVDQGFSRHFVCICLSDCVARHGGHISRGRGGRRWRIFADLRRHILHVS